MQESNQRTTPEGENNLLIELDYLLRENAMSQEPRIHEPGAPRARLRIEISMRSFESTQLLKRDIYVNKKHIL